VILPSSSKDKGCCSGEVIRSLRTETAEEHAFLAVHKELAGVWPRIRGIGGISGPERMLQKHGVECPNAPRIPHLLDATGCYSRARVAARGSKLSERRKDGGPFQCRLRPPLQQRSSLLENELHGCLHQSRWLRTHDLAECRTGDVAVHGGRSEELGVVESIERFQAKFE
jgi:hypothetical protein